MEHEVIVEGFVLQVEVTHCENIPPCFNAWNSDWDFYGSRELEFKVLSAITYDDEGLRQKVSATTRWHSSTASRSRRRSGLRLAPCNAAGTVGGQHEPQA